MTSTLCKSLARLSGNVVTAATMRWQVGGRLLVAGQSGRARHRILRLTTPLVRHMTFMYEPGGEQSCSLRPDPQL